MKNPEFTQHYLQAFTKLIGCNKTQVTNIKYNKNKVTLHYKNMLFNIASFDDIYDYYKMLLSTAKAKLLPLDIWIYLNEGVYSKPLFHKKLMESLNISELECYKTAMDISNKGNNDELMFWEHLHKARIENTYSKAINVGASVYCIDCLCNELYDILLNSKGNCSILEFWEVDISEYDDENIVLFYIYRKRNEEFTNYLLP